MRLCSQRPESRAGTTAAPERHRAALVLLLCSWWCWPGLSLSPDFCGHIPQRGQAAPTARWHLDPAPAYSQDRVEVGVWKLTTLRRKGAELAGGCCALVLTPGGTRAPEELCTLPSAGGKENTGRKCRSQQIIIVLGSADNRVQTPGKIRYSHNYSLVPSKRTSTGAAGRAAGRESPKYHLHSAVAVAVLPVPSAPFQRAPGAAAATAPLAPSGNPTAGTAPQLGHLVTLTFLAQPGRSSTAVGVIPPISH